MSDKKVVVIKRKKLKAKKGKKPKGKKKSKKSAPVRQTNSNKINVRVDLAALGARRKFVPKATSL